MRWKLKNVSQISSILGIQLVGPYERMLRLRHSFILSFFHVRSHPNEGIFGSFPGSSNKENRIEQCGGEREIIDRLK